MRAPVSFVASLVIAVAVSAGAQARPLLAVGVEAGEVVLVDPAKARSSSASRSAPAPRAASSVTRDRRRLLVAVAGPAKGTGSTRRRIERPRDHRHRGAQGHEADRHAARAVRRRPVADGRTAFLSNSETNEILVIDVGSGTVKKKIGIGAEPLDVRPARRQGRSTPPPAPPTSCPRSIRRR
jgi:YVTN family beta-propeller protein